MLHINYFVGDFNFDFQKNETPIWDVDKRFLINRAVIIYDREGVGVNRVGAKISVLRN